MTRWHAVVWIAVTVAGVFLHLVDADAGFASECRAEELGGPRHREARERLPRHSRQGVEHVGLALSVDHVVEERAELGTGQLGRRIGHGLDELLLVELR